MRKIISIIEPQLSVMFFCSSCSSSLSSLGTNPCWFTRAKSDSYMCKNSWLLLLQLRKVWRASQSTLLCLMFLLSKLTKSILSLISSSKVSSTNSPLKLNFKSNSLFYLLIQRMNSRMSRIFLLSSSQYPICSFAHPAPHPFPL